MKTKERVAKRVASQGELVHTSKYICMYGVDCRAVELSSGVATRGDDKI